MRTKHAHFEIYGNTVYSYTPFNCQLAYMMMIYVFFYFRVFQNLCSKCLIICAIFAGRPKRRRVGSKYRTGVVSPSPSPVKKATPLKEKFRGLKGIIDSEGSESD